MGEGLVHFAHMGFRPPNMLIAVAVHGEDIAQKGRLQGVVEVHISYGDEAFGLCAIVNKARVTTVRDDEQYFPWSDHKPLLNSLEEGAPILRKAP